VRVPGVLPGEGVLVFRLLALMVVAWSGFAIGGNAVEGLLLARVGAGVLPYLFVVLGVATAAVMLGVSARMGRARLAARGRWSFSGNISRPLDALVRVRGPQRSLLLALLGMALAVLALRVLLDLGASWLLGPAWLAMMVLWTGAIIVTWGIAAAVHDTRQARRLFPLYASGVILGTALGGFATAPLTRWLDVADLLYVWAAALMVSFLLARSALLLRPALPPPTRRAQRRSARSRTAEGFLVVRRSRLLTRMSVCVALFAVLYFTLTLLFARAVTARFPDPSEVAGFLGLFMGATSGTALLVSVFAASRVAARFGVAATVVALPLIYAAGFALLVGYSTFYSLLGFRFVQMIWMHGVWVSGWQALYNVVPAERRDSARTFVEGVAYQGGVTCSGLLLVLADRVLDARTVSAIALIVAVAAVVIASRLRDAYADAVAEALRSGNPDVFFAEDRPFAGIGRDSGALAIAARAADDPHPGVRRFSIEILSQVETGEARPALTAALTDEDATVRAAALRGLAHLPPAEASLPNDTSVANLLRDSDADVRLAALEVVRRQHGAGGRDGLIPLLEDADPRVRARASALLLGRHRQAERTLAEMIASRHPEWRAEAISAWGAQSEGISGAVDALGDDDAQVRRAAISVLAGRDGAAAIAGLISALADPDPSNRAAAVEGLVETGSLAIVPLREAAGRPELEPAAMRALVRLGAVEGSVKDDHVARNVSLALRYARFAASVVTRADPGLEFLLHCLRNAGRRHALDALFLSSRVGDSDAGEVVDMALENLDSPDPTQRANALETLEAVGNRDVMRPLLAVWEPRPSRPVDVAELLPSLKEDPDMWVRAAAAFAWSQRSGDRSERAPAVGGTATLGETSAAAALGGEALLDPLDPLSSLSLMERIVFLRRVPLFVDLPPADLKHVAEIATEQFFSDGDIIAEQGELGAETYVVVSGSIRVVVSRDGGRPEEVARRTDGECVGEMAILSHAPRMASLIAQGDVRTLAIDRRRFERILRDRPDTSLAVMKVLSDRLRELHGAEPPEARS
jgi:HEAT repeat protein